MTYQLDEQFILKYTHLIQEVLADEARFVARHDLQHEKVHNFLFSKSTDTPFLSIPEQDRLSFRKYFYYGDNGTTPRTDVPFADSAADQASFFDQLHQQAKIVTYNFERMDFLRPSFSQEKDTDPAFSSDQQSLLQRALIYPMMHDLERSQIAEQKQKQAGQASGEETGAPTATGNPYQGLGENILVKGNSGQFDTLLTFAQIDEIAGQEGVLRAQGLEDQVVRTLLRQYIRDRFPNLDIFISDTGKIMPLLRAVGISASGAPQPENSRGEGLSFAELIAEMKLRQARQMQYRAVLASKGTLGPTANTYQVVDSTGIGTNVDGLNVALDQGGQGSRALFLVADNQGVGAKVLVDTAEERLGGDVRFNFSLYSKPDEDNAANPKIRLGDQELPLLNTPLLPLYHRLQEGGEYRPAAAQPKPNALPDTVPAPEMPGQLARPLAVAPQRTVTVRQPEAPPPPMPNLGTRSGGVIMIPAVVHQPQSLPSQKVVRRPRGKGTATSRLPGRPPIKPPTTTKPTPQTAASAPTVKPKQKDESEAGQTAEQNTPQKPNRRGLTVALSTGLPIAATLGGGLVNMLL